MTQGSPLLQFEQLVIRFDTSDGMVQAVNGLDFSLYAGECLGVVGESGSGKSQCFLAAMGLLSANGQTTGQVLYNQKNLLQLPSKALNTFRGDRISMIFQDPLTSLTPHLRIGDQMQEVLRSHQKLSSAESRQICLEWLERVRITEGSRRLTQYPHELSGGMRQRVMIAMAMLCEPDVLIADEPTTALDVTIQAEVLDLMDELRQEHGTAIVLITHDMGVVARMCDRVLVMRHGDIVESGSCQDVFYRPSHAYTRMLLEAVPAIPITHLPEDPVVSSDVAAVVKRNAQLENELSDERSNELNTGQIGNFDPTDVDSALSKPEPCLQVDNLRVGFKVSSGWLHRARTLRAVDNISFTLNPGESLGIVGESGSGKSTLARAILQLLPTNQGHVSWLGNSLGQMSKTMLREQRQDLQIVFQDPLASLNPSLPVGESIMEPLRVHKPKMDALERTRKVAVMMHKVGLDPLLINRYPHELSGGQNQRVGIARAMILQPRLLICDEAVSALDVSIQAQVIKLIQSLQQEFKLSLIFISHDLSVVYAIAHRILVMYLGSMVELAPTARLFTHAAHPYTQQLISAVPVADPLRERQRHRIRLAGELTSPLDPAAKLRFLPSRVASGDIHYVPQLRQLTPEHLVAEHDSIDTLLR